MRKTADLVNEMRHEAKQAWMVAIAVGFEHETQFVFSTMKYPLVALNNLVKRGGAPIGLLRFEKEGTAIQGSYRPFAEYENEAWVQEYLAGLLTNTAEIVELSRNQPITPVAY
jgi:hypothetical protein